MRSFTYEGGLVPGSYASRIRKPFELMLVPMIDIFTVLVTFLLMTAVFSRITILQLELPSANASAGSTQPEFRLEVIVREEGMELTNGTKLIAAIPKVNGEYDLKTLSELALSLKREYPDANDASVLLERNIEYDYLIQAMDAIRSTEVSDTVDSTAVGQVAADQQAAASRTEVQSTGESKRKRVELFARIAVGVAP